MKGEAEVNCSRARLVISYSTAERFRVRNAGRQTRASDTVSASKFCDGADKCIAWLVLCVDTFAKLSGSLLARVYRCFDRSVI